MNQKGVLSLLRVLHLKDVDINEKYSFSDLFNKLYNNIQRARYEQFIINVASAYDGYKFCLPFSTSEVESTAVGSCIYTRVI